MLQAVSDGRIILEEYFEPRKGAWKMYENAPDSGTKSELGLKAKGN